MQQDLGQIGYSHPNQPVRHNYPVAVSDAGVMTALGLLQKTLPYALMRFGILVGMSVVTIIWWVTTLGGTAFLSQNIHPIVGYAWFFTGAGTFGYVWWAIVRYFLYLLKAGHIAVLTELITQGQVGNGSEGMFEYGKRVVTDRFGQVNMMFALDMLVHGVVRAFNRTLNWVANLLPVPGLRSVAGLVNAVVFAAATYIDETILSYNLARQDEDPWRSAKDGLIYYAQNTEEVLKTGIWIVVLDKVLTFFVWIGMLLPAFMIAFVLPPSIKGVGSGLALGIGVLFAANVRSAFLKPLFLIMVMIKFHVSIQDQAIDETWDGRLEAASSKFRDLKNKITGSASPTPEPATAPQA